MRLQTREEHAGALQTSKKAMTPCFSSGQEVPAFSADNRPLFAVPRVLQTEEEGAALVVLDLLPRVRYRVPLHPASAAPPDIRFCFESGLLICPDSESPSTAAVVINLSDRMASLCSGSWESPTALLRRLPPLS